MKYNTEEYKRKCLYIKNEFDKQLNVKSAEMEMDKSQVLNLALEMYFQNKPQQEVKK